MGVMTELRGKDLLLRKIYFLKNMRNTYVKRIHFFFFYHMLFISIYTIRNTVLHGSKQIRCIMRKFEVCFIFYKVFKNSKIESS